MVYKRVSVMRMMAKRNVFDRMLIIGLPTAALVVIWVFFVRPVLIHSAQVKADRFVDHTRLLGLGQAVGIYVESQHGNRLLPRLNTRNWIPVLTKHGLVDGDLSASFESGENFRYGLGPGHMGTLSAVRIRVYAVPKQDAERVLVCFDDGRVGEIPKKEFEELLAAQTAEWPGWDVERPSDVGVVRP